MRKIKTPITVSTSFLLVFLLSSVEVKSAPPRLPCLNCNRDQLEGWCNENGGIFFPPGVGGAYACLLPDGTLVGCGGTIPICTQSRTVGDAPLLDLKSIISMQEQLLTIMKSLEARIKRLEDKRDEIENKRR
jgi:hypothetical protein